jgi:peptidoglycan/xylan/chitin deacetylase (PgdA/CDA1 family)/SAM-dependent methyltransferase
MMNNPQQSPAATPLVSVVIPAFNAEATLGATLDSLAAQSQSAWEAVVVDDGSTDQTASIIRERSAVDGRIVGVFARHGGVSLARNAGLDRARGDWVVFLDSDDCLPPDHLHTMLAAAASERDATLLHAGWRRFTTDGALLDENPAKPLADAFAACAQSCPFAIHSALTRRDALLKVGRFDDTVGICEDWDLWQRLARTGASFAPVPDHFVDVRLRPGSLSSDGARLLEAGLSQIRRGFSADPRVPQSDPRFVASADPAGMAPASAYFSLWSIGRIIGAAQDLEEALALVPDLQLPGNVELHAAAATLVSGLLTGNGRPMAEWNQVWPRIAAGFDHFIGWLDARDPATRQGGWLRVRVEQHVSHALPELPELRVGTLRITTRDLTSPIGDLDPGDGVERLSCRIEVAGVQIGSAALLTPGVVPARVLAQAVLDQIGRDRVFEALAALAALAALDAGRRPSLRARLKKVFARPAALDPAFAPLKVLATATADPAAASIAEATSPWRGTDEGSQGGAEWTPPDYSSPEYWETVFATRDPWEYQNAYEELKYTQTLAMIPEGAVSRALEIACAEGHFTQLLAKRVGTVLATDISRTAVHRAAERCVSLGNVTFDQLDLATDDVPGQFDLIVCSEVLYYQPDHAALTAFSEKIAVALEGGGHLLLAHGNLVVDEPEHTGFPWPHQFGSRGIGEALAAHPSLSLEREFKTPLYRIQLFRRTAEPVEPVHEIGQAAVRLPLRVASQVRWRGGREIRAAAEWNNFPILMYHRIADTGPEALARYRISPAEFAGQLALLRQAGWEGVSMARLIAALYDGKPLPERSVLLSLDDAYLDFLEEALPILHRFEFPATVFVPVGKAGGGADWDSRFGDAAPILGWDDLEILRHSDVTLGSHAVAHQALPALTAVEQIQELAASRAELASRVSAEVESIAYPFGEATRALHQAARDCGYRIGFACDDGWVQQTSNPLSLPRVEVWGGLGVDGFADLLGIKR